MKVQDIVDGKSLLFGLLTKAYETPLIFTAYEGYGVYDPHFYVVDGTGTDEIIPYSNTAWYTFRIEFNAADSYDLYINSELILDGRDLADISTKKIEYLAIVSADGPTGSQVYIDDIAMTWTREDPASSVPMIETFSNFNDGTQIKGAGDIGWWSYVGDSGTHDPRSEF